jgi:hypothetical protein
MRRHPSLISSNQPFFKRALSDNPLLSSFTTEAWQKLLASTNPQKELSMAIYKGIREQLLNTRKNGKRTTILLANSSNQAGHWLNALPLPFAGLTMTPREYRTALRLRTVHDTLPKEEKCKMCKDGFSDKQGHHELSCAGKGHRILRHNAIRDCLFDVGLKECGKSLDIYFVMALVTNRLMSYLLRFLKAVTFAWT